MKTMLFTKWNWIFLSVWHFLIHFSEKVNFRTWILKRKWWDSHICTIAKLWWNWIVKVFNCYGVIVLSSICKAWVAVFFVISTRQTRSGNWFVFKYLSFICINKVICEAIEHGSFKHSFQGNLTYLWNYENTNEWIDGEFESVNFKGNITEIQWIWFAWKSMVSILFFKL